MKFTQHALVKLAIYCIPPNTIIEENKHAIHELYDKKERSTLLK